MTKFPDFATCPMTDVHREIWVKGQASQISIDFVAKFMRGRREKGSDLGTVPLDFLFTEARNECYDQLSYIAELERRVGVLLVYISKLESVIEAKTETQTKQTNQ